MMSRSYWLYWLALRFWNVRGEVLEDLVGALGLAKALEIPSLFDLKGSLWSLLSDQLDT